MVLCWALVSIRDMKCTGGIIYLHMKTPLITLIRYINLKQLKPSAVHGIKYKGITVLLYRKVFHAAKIISPDWIT